MKFNESYIAKNLDYILTLDNFMDIIQSCNYKNLYNIMFNNLVAAEKTSLKKYKFSLMEFFNLGLNIFSNKEIQLTFIFEVLYLYSDISKQLFDYYLKNLYLTQYNANIFYCPKFWDFLNEEEQLKYIVTHPIGYAKYSSKCEEFTDRIKSIILLKNKEISTIYEGNLI